MKQDLSELPNYQVATIALALLSGATRRVHTEEIAECAMELAPEKFSWQVEKYRDRNWPDKFLVKCSLEDAQKSKYGSLVDGQCAADLSKDGWRLTPAGAEWFKTLGLELEELSDAIEKTPLAPRDAKRFVSRLTKEPLFRLYVTSHSLESASPYAFTDMLNTSPDAPTHIIATKFERLLASAHLAGDETILKFLDACGSEFARLLGESATAEGQEAG